MTGPVIETLFTTHINALKYTIFFLN
jgi:hypothetical protein